MRLGPGHALDPARFSAYEALPARVGVLDASGTLVWANRAWLAFRRGQGRDTLAALAVGTNLITFSRQAGGTVPKLIAAGVRAVLDRHGTGFRLDFALPELDGSRTEMSVTPMPDGAPGAIVTLSDERTHRGPNGLSPRSEPVGVAIETLTPRELEVLQLMARGLDNTAIAERLGVGYTTVRAHVSAIMAKLDARSRLAAVVRALQRGIVQPPTGAPDGSEGDAERVHD